jgi:hypothetical protein
MQGAGVVSGALGASAEREGRVLHISLTGSLRIASTLIGAGCASGEHQHNCSENNASCEQLSDGDRSSIGYGHLQANYWSVIASAQRLPLTIALSRLGGQPVSVQAPATSKFAIGLRWMGRWDLVPGLSERIALEIVR